MRPALVFTGGTLDRAAHRRSDAGWIAGRRVDAASYVLPVWRDLSLVIEADGVKPAVLSGEPAVRALEIAADWGFLGVDGTGRAAFAAALPSNESAESACLSLAPGSRFRDLGKLATVLDAADGALLAYARALMRWHRQHRFCGACGAPTHPDDGGHMRRCTAAECGEKLFPRTDPVVIMLVTRGDSCLLARQPSWISGLYSALAGFVEPGEQLEEAVVREIREEAGIEATDVRYVASQPWPFPQSLMLGFRAEAAAGGEIAFDATEVEDARWFQRDAFADLRGAGIRLPYRGTIARALIEGWLAEATQGRGTAHPANLANER